jgi:hypothetical protein
MPLKIIFHICFIVWSLMSLTVSALQLFNDPAIYWLAVLVAALAPLLNMVLPYDSIDSLHQKVKLPKVSLIVMLSLAVVLLTIPDRNVALWLMLGCLGGFLLDTYWARNEMLSE